MSARACRRRHAGEGGYILLLTLAAIGVFSIVVIALLSMSLTDARVQSSLSSAQRSNRAVDSALTTALNKLKVAPAGAVGDPGTACSDTAITIDATPVTVTCEPTGTPV